MKLSDVIALIGAGYTKEEIEALEAYDAMHGGEQPKPEAPQPEAPQPEAPKQ